MPNFPRSIPIRLDISISRSSAESSLITRALSAVEEERSDAARKAAQEEAENLARHIRSFRDLLTPLGVFYDVARESEVIDRLSQFTDDPLTLYYENIYFSYFWDSEEVRPALQVGLNISESETPYWSTIAVTSILDLGYAIEQISERQGMHNRCAHLPITH